MIALSSNRSLRALPLSLLLALAGCAKPSAPAPDPAVNLRANAPSLIATRRQLLASPARESDEAVRAAAAELLRAGTGLSGAEATRCREQARERSEVAELCLALWAYGPEDSPELAKELLAGAPRSSLAALGLGWRPALLRGLSQSALEETLRRLERQPVWFRGDLLRAWIEQNGLSGGPPAVAFAQINPREPLQPADLVSYFTLARDYFPQSYPGALAAYCRTEARGEARLRCWRLVGTLLNEPGGEAWREPLRVYAPDAGEEAWALFRQHYPALAYRIDATYREGK